LRVHRGQLYVASPGNVFENAGNPQPPHLHRYNPATNSWVELAPPPRNHALGVMRAINGELYLVGGFEGGNRSTVASAALDVYNPATNSWTPGPPMPTARSGATGQVLNGVLYMVGGSDFFGNVFATVEAYSPSTNSWTTKAAMPGARRVLASALLNGKLFAIGGSNAGNTPVPTNQVYTP
jgi:N-acetylneuraminic acid mutarotase